MFNISPTEAGHGKNPPIPARGFFVRPGFMLAVLSVCLVAGLLPYSATLISIHPDERYYFDGGAIMLEDGSWLTPRTGVGEVRLKKPPVSYWIEAAGMKALGISVAGARVPWVVISAAIVLLTYLLARAANAGQSAALFAAALLAGNVAYVHASTVAIPDLPLTLFILVATIGFIGLLFRDDRTTIHGWMAYGGAALAVLTKGLLPLALLFWSLAFTFLSQEARNRRRRLMQPVPIAISVVAVGGWLVYQVAQGHSALASDFLQDQVIAKIGLTAASMSRSLLASLAGLVLPDILSLLALAYAALALGSRPSIRATGAIGAYLAGWVVLVVGIFLFSAVPTYRYSLPALPHFSVLLAVALLSVDGPPVRKFMRIVYRVTLAGAVLVVVALLALSALLLPFWQTLILAAALVAGSATIWRLTVQASIPVMSFAMATVPYGLCLLAFPVLAALLLPDIGAPLALAMRQEAAAADSILFVDDDLSAARVRLHSGSAHPFVQVRTLEGIDPMQFSMIITEEPEVAAAVRALGYEQREVRGGWRDIDVGDLLAALKSWRLADAREAFAERGYILTRPRGGGSAPPAPISPGPSGS